MEQVKNEINEVKKREEADKLARSNTVTTRPSPQQQQKQPGRQKKRYTRANSEKLFNDLENDIDDLLNDDDGMYLFYYSFYKSSF